MTYRDRLVVFPRPFAGIDHREHGPSRPVMVLAFAGPDAIGYHGDRRALVVDVYGNIEWISPDGLAIADATVLPVPEVVPHG